MAIIFTYEKIFKAYLSCRENKRKTINALDFELDFENKLRVLLRELKNKTYVPGRSICFAVDKPKIREIFAADFRDRIVHHLLVNEIVQYASHRFVFDSYACLKGKGTLKAVKRLQFFVKNKKNNQQRNREWYLKMDISSFFTSIDKNILFDIFSKFIAKLQRQNQWKTEMLWLGKLLIFHRCQENFVTKGDLELLASVPVHKSMFGQALNKGLPIGNYTSQFFANLYMNELDQFIKRKLKIKKYLRYVDDFVVIDEDVEKLRQLPKIVNEFLQTNLKLKLNEKKTKMQPTERGLDFLGYFIKPTHCLVKNDVVGRLKNKLHFNLMDDKKTVSVVNSYFGHFKHCSSLVLRKKICEKLPKQFEYLDSFLKINLVSQSL
ncbi:MAG: Retron-type reverse transcriptase [Candidatus Moranbacteria bacterium GW2011_GWE2_36_40]|nr:MAG: Retron-type reverse transcriptase [Candidatus Moranbacteria bacterium GW2011_GWE2_36_40]